MSYNPSVASQLLRVLFISQQQTAQQVSQKKLSVTVLIEIALICTLLTPLGKALEQNYVGIIAHTHALQQHGTISNSGVYTRKMANNC